MAISGEKLVKVELDNKDDYCEITQHRSEHVIDLQGISSLRDTELRSGWSSDRTESGMLSCQPKDRSLETDRE